MRVVWNDTNGSVRVTEVEDCVDDNEVLTFVSSRVRLQVVDISDDYKEEIRNAVIRDGFVDLRIYNVRKYYN